MSDVIGISQTQTPQICIRNGALLFNHWRSPGDRWLKCDNFLVSDLIFWVKRIVWRIATPAIAIPATAGFRGVLAIPALISSVTAIFCQKAAGLQSQMRLVGRFPRTKGRSPPPGLNRPYQKRFIARHPMCLDNSISYFLFIANFSE